jgi:AraC-like DNA-binding protein
MHVHKDRFRRTLQVENPGRLRPVFDDFHLLKMEGHYEYPRHQHANYEAILVERGPYRCELNGGELTLVDGQVLVIKPGDWHSDHLRDGQRHYVLHFRLASAPGEPTPPPVFHSDVSPEDQVCQGNYAREAWYLRELRHEAEHGLAYAAEVEDGLLSALFWRLVRGLNPAALSPEFRRLPGEEARRAAVAKVFARNLGNNLDVPALARELKVSPRQLGNQCQRLFGLSPARLLLKMKIECAEEMLRYQGRRVGEVSEALGFTSPFHFSAAFRRVRGHPPSEVRRK